MNTEERIGGIAAILRRLSRSSASESEIREVARVITVYVIDMIFENVSGRMVKEGADAIRYVESPREDEARECFLAMLRVKRAEMYGLKT